MTELAKVVPIQSDVTFHGIEHDRSDAGRPEDNPEELEGSAISDAIDKWHHEHSPSTVRLWEMLQMKYWQLCT
jgi:hypothetical protein